MKKKNFLMATYTLAIYAIVFIAMFTSCKSQSQKNAEAKEQLIYIREFKVVDVNGDTITVHMSNNGGVPSKAYKNTSK